MKTILKNELNIVTENEYELWCRCPAHRDINRPNLWVTKDNGLGYCFACGFKCRVKGLNMKVERVKKSKVNVNWNCILKNSISPHTMFWLNYLAIEWNVDINVLRSFNVIWNTTQRISSYFIPVYNENGIIIGIQKRYPDGQKIMIKNSKLGIFKPSNLKIQDTLFVCEGFSDSTVLTHLGFPTIGRISATSSGDVIVKFVKLAPTLKTIVIISDGDDVGGTGAEKLKTKLDKLGKYDIMIIYPLLGKDAREQYQLKGAKFTQDWIKEIR